MLTNSGNGNALFEPLASEVFTHLTGAAHPAAPQPIDHPIDDRHVGRYERASVRLDVVRRDGRLWAQYQATGDRLAFAENPVMEFELLPTEPADGNHFVLRDTPKHPWVPLTFKESHVLTSGQNYSSHL